MNEGVMSANGRLQKLQTALLQRGVKDVKFFFSPAAATPVTKVISDVANVLEAFLEGRAQPMPKIGDSVKV